MKVVGFTVLLSVVVGCSENGATATVTTPLPNASLVAVSGVVLHDGKPHTVDLLLLPFEGASTNIARDTSKEKLAGLYLFTTRNIDPSVDQVVVVTKDPTISARPCVVTLESVSEGARKGRGSYLHLDDSQGTGALAERDPIDEKRAAQRIAHLTWAEDQRIRAGVVTREDSRQRLQRISAEVLLRVPELQKAGVRERILNRAERTREQFKGTRILPKTTELGPLLDGDLRLERYQPNSLEVWSGRAKAQLQLGRPAESWMVDVLGRSGQLQVVVDAHPACFADAYRKAIERRFSDPSALEPRLFDPSSFAPTDDQIRRIIREQPEQFERVIRRND
ncbi:MAG: hypothetical protein AAF517_02905 [Planctomycetota bacterium]